MAGTAATRASPEKPRSYVWLPHQRAFLQSEAQYTLLVGGVRAGKTLVGSRQVLKWTQLYPGTTILVGRLTAKALGETTQKTLFSLIPRDLIFDWRAHEQHLWLKTPEPGIYSEILFYHLDDPGPLGSLELDAFWIDEAHEPDGSEVPEETFKILQTRLSGSHGPLRGIVTSNPGGRDWLYKYFVSGEAIPEEIRSLYAHFVARTSDNLDNLPETYRLIYTQHTDPETGELDQWGKRYLDASFDVFEGQIYPGFSEKRHMAVPEPWRRNGHELNFASIDWGIRNPTAILSGFVDFEGVLWVEDEFYYPNGGDAVLPSAAAWCKARGISGVVGDPSMLARARDGGESVGSRLAQEGVFVRPGNNEVLLGIEEVRRRLSRTVDGTDRGRPLLQIHPRCEHLIQELKQYRWAPDHTGLAREQPLKRDDHTCDALRYMAMAVRYGETGGIPESVVLEPPTVVHPEREILAGVKASRYERNWG